MMKGSGVHPALENLYAPVTVGHMFSDKVFAHAICGCMLFASAVLSLLLEKLGYHFIRRVKSISKNF